MTSPKSRACSPPWRRDQRDRAARRVTGGPRAARRRRLQRRALPGNRRAGRALAGARPSTSPQWRRSAGRRRDARIRPAGRGARGRRSAAGARGRGDPPPLVHALGRLDLPHGQARLRLRRRDPRDRRGAHRERGARVHVVGLGHLQPRVGPRGPRSRSELRRRGAHHRRPPASSKSRSPRCTRSWCSARRWSGTSPSGSGFPAR